ncbi:unnamed protein product [Mytilus edulis]|uniref:Reverse transcriptase zinc-binding domain-containing protein n=1 Tax=Mytilus edulis TaxID=6550 RepID=A0A8S3UJG1_MYTED|nr:unnamed protein product [Mytilus edulis]
MFIFSNLNDAVVMPYDTRKVQRINYNSLHNTGTTGDLNSSSEEDVHKKELIKKKIRSQDLKQQLKREKELEELKKHDEAVGGMVKGRNVIKGERKRSQKKKESAGEMEIIVSCKSDKEKNGRLTLLKKISYYYELYDWKALLQFYAAWIRRVESGQNKWSDDTADIETPLLASSVRSRQNRTAGCDVQEKAIGAYAILGEVLDNCGLEESIEKAAPPSTSMGFLGILFDTKMMVKKAGLDHYFYIWFTCEPILVCRIPVVVNVVCIIRQIAVNFDNNNSFFFQTALLLSKYNLPDIFDKNIPIPSKLSWKKLVKTEISSFWTLRLKEEAHQMSSLKFLNLNFGIAESTHPVWDSVGQNMIEIRKATTKVRMLTGTYMVQADKHKFSQYKIDPTCLLCHREIEDILHVLTQCPVLGSERKEYFTPIKQLVTENSPPGTWELLFNNKLAVTQLVLDKQL